MNYYLCNGGANNGGNKVPELISGYSKNITTLGAITHTFADGGVYQFYGIVITDDGTLPITLKLNNDDVNYSSAVSTEPTITFIYGQIKVKSGDVLTLSNTVAYQHRGMQLFIFRDSNIDNFNIIGCVINDNTDFVLPSRECYLEVYRYSFYQNRSYYNYVVRTVCSSSDSNDFISVKTPNENRYWYGGTWAIKI